MVYRLFIKLLLLVGFTFSLNTYGKDCSSTNISLVDQADVNLFQQAYGNGGICDTVLGDLDISEGYGTAITDLSPLRDLKFIRGALDIEGNDDLRSLSGLDNLIQAGGVYVNYNLMLSNCRALARVLGLGFGAQVGVDSDNMYISENARGCNSLSEVEVYLTKDPPIFCDTNLAQYSNPNLPYLPWFHLPTQQSVDTFREKFSSDCNAIQGVLDIGGFFSTFSYEQTDIVDLTPLAWIQAIDFLEVNFTQLTNLSGLEGLTGSVQGVRLAHNYRMESVAELSGIKVIGEPYWPNIGGHFSLISLVSLRSLSGLDKTKLSETPGNYGFLNNLELIDLPLSNCELDLVDDNYFSSVDVVSNLPGCLSLDEIRQWWGVPRKELVVSYTEGGKIVAPDGWIGFLTPTSFVETNAGRLYISRPSTPIPKGYDFSVGTSSKANFEFENLVQSCGATYVNGSYHLDMSRDCYLHAKFSPLFASFETRKTTILPATSCKAFSSKQGLSLQWTEAGIKNISDLDIVKVVCPIILTDFDSEISSTPRDIQISLKFFHPVADRASIECELFLTDLSESEQQNLATLKLSPKSYRVGYADLHSDFYKLGDSSYLLQATCDIPSGVMMLGIEVNTLLP